jgi:hypothetical protein
VESTTKEGSLERPKNRRDNNYKMDLKEMGYDEGAVWIHMEQDMD